ncbi:MAG: SlyX family protein [Alphaproteobacteria bacterium]|nr:SlyX family protein [Alphaproteobacteria bacterium]
MKTQEEKLIDIEITLTEHEKTINELNDECIRMNKTIDALVKQVKLLSEQLKDANIKPLSEETRPPHY